MARHRTDYKSYLNNKNSPKNTILTLWNRLMSSVLRTVKWFLWKNVHAKTESNSKREKVNMLKRIRAVLADVLLVGLEWNIMMPQESITLKKRKDAKYSNREYWKIQRKRQTASWEQKKYKNTRKIKIISWEEFKYREENREAMRQTQRKRYQREKNRINAQKKRNAKEERRTVTNQPIVILAYYIFYSFHPICNIYYSSYHDQLISLCISFHSIDF